MDGDPRFARFFAYMSLFVSFMLMLVLADNFLLLYLGWEGVGLCSYLLIGFWFERPGRRRRGEEGVHHDADRRRRAPDRDRPDLVATRHARLRAGLRAAAPVLSNGTRDRRSRCSCSRGGREVGAVAAAHVAPRRHGGPDARLGADPRGHHGHRGRVPGRAVPRPLRGRPASRSPSVAVVGRRDGDLRGPVRDRPGRHQADARVLHDQPDRLHVLRAPASAPTARPSSCWSRTRSSRPCCSCAPAA